MEQQICQQDQQIVTQQQLAQVAQQQMAFAQQQLVQPQQMAQMVQQQQMAQMAQLAQQQQQQQMMLCPIRVVYETPVLMQSGDQHQHNQTILVNSPNLPPWVRPVQNQVIYVQQVPQNYGQQYIDPNMLQQNYIQYVQNPQVVNQNLQEQLRQMQQMPNVMPAVQNVQNLQGYPNVQVANVQMQDNRVGMVQNFEQPQNVQNVQGQVLNTVNRQIVNVNQNEVLAQSGNVVNAPQAQTVSQNIQQKPVEVPKQMVYRTIRPQTSQQQIITRPSIPNQVQTLQAVPNVQNVQNIQMQNYRQPMIARPQIHTNIVQFPTNVSPNIVNNPINSMVNTIQHIDKNTAAVDINKVNNMSVAYTAVRNGQTYSYRAIQPRPMGKNVPNLLPMAIPTQTLPRPELPLKPPPIPVTNNAPMVKIEGDSIPVNRKRKSESPDEVKKKIAPNSVVFGNFTITPTVQGTQSTNFVNSDKISVSTNHTPSMLQIKPLEVGTSDKNRITIPMTQSVETLPLTRDSSSQVEKDKLVRATVFTQARGRMLNDKPNVPIVYQTVATKPQMITTPVLSNSSVMQVKMEKPEEERKPIESVAQPSNKDVKMTDISAGNSKAIDVKPNPVVKKEEATVPASKSVDSPVKAQKISPAKASRDMPSLFDDVTPLKHEPKLEIPKPELDTVKKKPVRKEKVPTVEIEKAKAVSEDKKEKEEPTPMEVKSEDDSKKDYKNISVADMAGAEIQIVDGTIVRSDKERDFILTHVLDGYVIQESNVPFAIRKPLIEKTIQPNVSVDKESKAEMNTKDETTESAKTNLTKDCVVVLNKKIPDLATLKIDETIQRSEEAKENSSNSDNPFGGLKQDAVKSWSVDQLSAHLAKNEWAETASMFRDHEIDGESLFLVSKPQLLTIGVNETHADVLWEFVKN